MSARVCSCCREGLFSCGCLSILSVRFHPFLSSLKNAPAAANPPLEQVFEFPGMMSALLMCLEMRENPAIVVRCFPFFLSLFLSRFVLHVRARACICVFCVCFFGVSERFRVCVLCVCGRFLAPCRRQFESLWAFSNLLSGSSELTRLCRLVGCVVPLSSAHH